MCPDMDEKALLELFASFVEQHEKGEPNAKSELLKAKIRKNLDPFPARFAEGAQSLLKSLEPTTAK